MDIIDQPALNENAYLSVDEVTRRGYRFEFGDYFNQAIEILKGNVGAFALATLVMFAIQIVGGILPFIGTFVGLFLTPGFYAGFVLMSHKASLGEKPEVGDLFNGFRGGAYGRVLGTYLLTVVIMIALVLFVAVPIILAAGPNVQVLEQLALDLSSGSKFDMDSLSGLFSNPDLLWLLILVFVGVIYLGVNLCLAMTFATLHSTSATEALKSSFRIVKGHWFWFLVFTGLLSICSTLGIIALCVGILVTYPIAMIGIFSAFDQIMKGKHPIYPN